MSNGADPPDAQLANVRGVGGFPQESAIDWAASNSNTVSFTHDLFSRISRAGVEALTLCTGRAIFLQAQLDSRGQIRIQDALSKIGTFSSRNELLAFGIGYKSIVHNLSQSQEGLLCLGVCCCLNEGFGTQISSEVMKALCSLYNPPADYEPPLQQWYLLIHACSGVLINSEFGHVLRGFTMHCSVPGHNDIRVALNPSKIAEALKDVFQITRGSLRSIYLQGGAECAWIVATANWLFGLSVSVENEHGQILYHPSALEQQTQRSDIAQVIWSLESFSMKTEVAQKSYAIPRGQLITRFHRDEQQRVTTYGRIDWSTCLVDTFGPPMARLLRDLGPQTGKCLGAAACLYEHVACDVEVSHMIRKNHAAFRPGANPSSYGHGFFTHARRLLPELQETPDLLDLMESIINMPPEEALEIFLDTINTIRRDCKCQFCSHDIEPEKTRIPPDGPGQKYCLVYLIRTLLKIIHSMAYLANPPTVQIAPTVAGLKRMYDTLDIAKASPRRIPSNGLLLSLGHWSDISERLYTMFTGQTQLNSAGIRQSWCSAVAGDGICLYLNTLCAISADPDSMCRVMIVPGTILWQNYTTYTEVMDVESSKNGGIDPPWLAEKELSMTSYDSLCDSSSPDLEAELLVIETTRSTVVHVSWLVSCSKGSLFVGPAVISSRMHYGFVGGSCYKTLCEPLDGINTILLKGEGRRAGDDLLRRRTRIPLIRFLSSDLAIWVALINSDPSHGHPGFLQGQQCASCTIKAAVNRTPFADFDLPPVSILTWL